MKSLLSQSESLAHIIAPFPRATAINRLYHEQLPLLINDDRFLSKFHRPTSAWTAIFGRSSWNLAPVSKGVCVCLPQHIHKVLANKHIVNVTNWQPSFWLSWILQNRGRQATSISNFQLFFLNGLEQQPYLCRSWFPSSSDEFWVASASKSSFKR
jgi:hypothetical protein